MYISKDNKYTSLVSTGVLMFLHVYTSEYLPYVGSGIARILDSSGNSDSKNIHYTRPHSLNNSNGLFCDYLHNLAGLLTLHAT